MDALIMSLYQDVSIKDHTSLPQNVGF